MSARMSAVTARSFVVTFFRLAGVSGMKRRIGAVVRRLGEIESDGNADHDPLAHPALRMMSSRELADLPFPRSTGEGTCR